MWMCPKCAAYAEQPQHVCPVCGATPSPEIRPEEALPVREEATPLEKDVDQTVAGIAGRVKAIVREKPWVLRRDPMSVGCGSGVVVGALVALYSFLRVQSVHPLDVLAFLYLPLGCGTFLMFVFPGIWFLVLIAYELIAGGSSGSKRPVPALPEKDRRVPLTGEELKPSERVPGQGGPSSSPHVTPAPNAGAPDAITPKQEPSHDGDESGE
jgi:hypothetical protein